MSKLFKIEWFSHNARLGQLDCLDDNPSWAIRVKQIIQGTTVTSIKSDDAVVWTRKHGWYDDFFAIKVEDALSRTGEISDTAPFYAPYISLINQETFDKEYECNFLPDTKKGA